MARPEKRGKKWRIRWVDASGARCSETHDTHEDATYALQRHELEAKDIRRGLKAPRRPERTFDDLAHYWLVHRASRKRSGRDDESMLRRHLRPAFGHLLLDQLTVEAVDRFRARLDLSPKSVHNVLTLLIAMLNQAVDLCWLDRAPRIRKPKIRTGGQDYNYLRSHDEIRALLTAARDEGEDVFTLYATAVYTGMRAGELAGLRWECVDLDRRQILVKRSFDGPTKSDETRVVPILSPLLPVLRQWSAYRCGGLVFPNRADRMHQPSARVFQEVLHRVLEVAGFAPVRVGKRLRRYITFHGLRHTFASHWMMGGGELFKLQRIGGWKSTAMVQRYAHLAPDAFEADYDRLGGALTAVAPAPDADDAPATAEPTDTDSRQANA